MKVDVPDLYIGIDPDVQASGFAIWDKKHLQLHCYDLPDLLSKLTEYNSQCKVVVKLEAGWLIKGNWHKGGSKLSGNAVGRNHEIGRQIAKYCDKYKIRCDLVKPLGYSGWKHERFCIYTKWPKSVKTNPETRVAGLLVYGY